MDLDLPPDVDVVIAVHTPTRPVARAVASVIDHNSSNIRVSVVCHNTNPEGIRAVMGRLADDPRVRLLHLEDNIRRPSGPFNAGLDAATGKFTSVMGSDDELEPGAIDSWLALASRESADVVIPRLCHVGGNVVPTPPTRPFRKRDLDGVKDRLSYRSAPLGLVSRRAFGAERWDPDVAAGGDVSFVTSLWFSGRRICFDRNGPAYLIHDDAGDRVTFTAKPIADDMRFMDVLFDERFPALNEKQRHAVVVKLLRIHVFGAVHNRPEPSLWTDIERTSLANVARRCVAQSPSAARVLSKAETSLLQSICDPQRPVSELLAHSKARRRFALPAAILTSNLIALFAREAPLRMMVASLVVRLSRSSRTQRRR